MDTRLVKKEENGNSNDRDTLFMVGGVALVVFGTGLILSNPVVRRYMGQMGLGDVIGNFIPDVERYFKLRSM
jgi:hypothetical protein